MRKIWICLLFIQTCVCSVVKADELNLLTGKFQVTDVQRDLLPTRQWVPFPDYQDRIAWSELTKPVATSIIEKGNSYLDYQWQVVKASDYLAYERTGSRVIMEKPMNENAIALSHLFLAELAEGKGRYLDQIINGTWYFTEMSTWSLSAHLPAFQSSKRTLPQEGIQVVDLVAGDMGSMLSWIYYYLQPEMDKINPEISKRLKKSIQARVITPYLERNDMWWQALAGKQDQMVNNWNPWCNFNVLTCLLLIEDDADRQRMGIYKTMQSVDKFINYVKSDGACEEGPSYWGHAAGKLYDYLKILADATGNKINIFNQPVVRNMGEYIAQSYIGGDNWVVNFADASAKGGGDPYLIFRYGKAVNSAEMIDFARYLETKRKPSFKADRDIFRTLEDLLSLSEIKNGLRRLPTNNYKWYPQTEFLYMKEGDSFFAAKGGYNNESHNHNDIGTFILYRAEKPIFIDAGVGTYNKKTFSNERYDIWSMQSGYHNLPQINGHDQVFGASYKAQDVSFDPKKKLFKLNIAGAYSSLAAVNSWDRSYQLKNGVLEIIDKFDLKTPTVSNVIHFLLAEKPVISEGKIALNGGKYHLEYNAAEFEAAVEAIPQDDIRLSQVWGDAIFRLSLKAKKIKEKGTYIFTVK